VLTALVLTLMASGQDPEPTTLPRQADTQPYEKRDAAQGVPTDPLFDKARVATDDPSFILTAVENGRQGALDAQGAARQLSSAALRATAAAIGSQNETTTRTLEALAKRKGWRLPASNPARASTLPAAAPDRADANFIVNQISSHQATVAQYQAQIAGKGDPELKRALKQALPGYEKNLARLLAVKP
jgi:predicted outer membrane protein